MGTKEPVLVRAAFFSYTSDESKDYETGVFVAVKTIDDKALLAHADNMDCTGRDAKMYVDGSGHSFHIKIDNTNITKSTCSRFKVKIWQQTIGRSKWKFDARVILAFSDNTNLVASCEEVLLVNNGASVEFCNI